MTEKPSPPSDRLAEEAERDLQHALAIGRMWCKFWDEIFAPPKKREDK